MGSNPANQDDDHPDKGLPLVPHPTPDKGLLPLVSHPTPDKGLPPLVSHPTPDKGLPPLVPHPAPDKGLPPLVSHPAPDKGLPPLVPHPAQDKGLLPLGPESPHLVPPDKGLLPLVPEGGPSDEGFYLWFVTFVTHCSRVSERMVEFDVTDTEGKGLHPVVFNPDEQVAVAESLFDTAKRHRFAFVVLNVLPDHVHAMIPAASEKVLNARVRILKVYSAQAINQRRGSPKGTHAWAQKFNREVIESDESLARVYEYIIGNHQKHQERWGDRLIHTWDKGLLPLVKGHCVDPLDITDPYDK